MVKGNPRDNQSERARRDASHRRGRSTSYRGGAVLIVDGDNSARQSLQITLIGLGYDTVAVATGEEALAELPLRQFDLVLLDMILPGMRGIEVCRALRRASSRVAIIVLTLHQEEDLKVQAFEAGADDYIPKPVGLREFAARVRAAIRRAVAPIDL